ncbi:MAG: hypothetical protein WAV09_04210 [Minisyncoccia bacterium]
MKYFYTNEKGEKIESPLERWAWGVVYKPTDEQIEKAKKKSVERSKELTAKRNKALKQMREDGASKDEIKAVTESYNTHIRMEVTPEQNEFSQFTDDGVFHRFAEIEKADGVHREIDIFSMYRTDDKELKHRVDIEVTPGMQLFHFYRNIVLNYEDKENMRKVQIYVFGWKQRGAKMYHYILPDDRIVTSNKDIDITRFNI